MKIYVPEEEKSTVNNYKQPFINSFRLNFLSEKFNECLFLYQNIGTQGKYEMFFCAVQIAN